MEGVMIPLGKPGMRLYNDGGAVYGKRWVSRMNMEGAINGSSFDYFQPSASGLTVPDYRPMASLRSLISFMADFSTTSYYDGLLPLLADSNNRTVTRLLALLQRLGSDDATVYGDSGLAVRQDFSKGLEQVFTGIQVARGQTAANGYDWLDYSRYGWMFTDVTDRRSGTPISVDLNAGLNELIGDNTKGLSRFVDDRGGTMTTPTGPTMTVLCCHGQDVGRQCEPLFYPG